MKSSKRYRDIILGILAGMTMAAAVPAVNAARRDIGQVAPFSPDALWLLKQARVIVEAYQVDAASNDIEESSMVHGAMRGMLSAWKDPYTRFLDPEQLEEEKAALEGSFGGLGINIASRDGKILVINPIEGTPADRAGIRPMDEIVRVNDDIIIGWELDRVVKQLRGDPGTEVSIGVRRPNESKLFDFKIVRDTIKIETVDSEMLDGKIGYIRLRQFIKTSAPDVGRAVIKLKNDDARGLILDLRNNGGGLLDSARDICDLFIDGGLVVSTKGRVESANEEFYVHDGVLTKLPLVVLINEGSASASEIVSGALRDRNGTLLIGAKSFGKGSVQVLFNLSDGSGMFVTTARYFTPNGLCIDKVGLSPDIYVKSVWSDEDLEPASADAAPRADAPTEAASGKAPPAEVREPAGLADAVEKSEDPQLERARQTLLRLIAGEKPESLRDPMPVVSAETAAASDDISPAGENTTSGDVTEQDSPERGAAPRKE